MKDRIQYGNTYVSSTVFLIGRDRTLLSRRERVLQDAGWQVRTLSPEEAAEQAHSTDPRLWIFCGSSIELASIIYLACSIRRYSPASRLVLVEKDASTGIESSLFHRVVDCKAGAHLLAAVIDGMAPAA